MRVEILAFPDDVNKWLMGSTDEMYDTGADCHLRLPIYHELSDIEVNTVIPTIIDFYA